MRETDLYPPVKRFLEAQGYEVKAEVGACDVVALRSQDAPLIVELKTAFSIRLVLQAIDRQAMTDAVYIAVPPPKRRDYWDIVKLCRRLGLGLLIVAGGNVEALADPAPYKPRKMPRRAGMLLKEFSRRAGDPNTGGMQGKRMTAYRQDALRLVGQLSVGASSTAELRRATGVARATAMLQRDVYGWFSRSARGVYVLSPNGERAAAEFAAAIAALAPIPPPAAPASAATSAEPAPGRRASRRGGGAARDTARR